MKRTKRVFAILMAAIFALSLVPGGAWAAAKSDSGEMYNGTSADTGTITIKNTTANETYNVYRIFDLASFNDYDTTPGVHSDSTSQTSSSNTGEAYSYVIRQYTDDIDANHATHTNDCVNPWYTFLFATGAAGTNEAYAQRKTVNATATNHQLFWVEPEAITLTDAEGNPHSDYHVVTATELFSNAWDVNDTGDNATTFPYIETDYVDPDPDGDKTPSEATINEGSIKVVQDFAQNALAYARKQVGNADQISADYSEVSTGTDITISSAPLGYYLMGTTTGTLASLDTTNKDLTVYDKNEVPTLFKKVLKKGAAIKPDNYEYLVEDADWVANTDADINDLVQFRAVITAKQGAKGYKLHDVMEDGLQVLHQTYDANHVMTSTSKPAGTTANRYQNSSNNGSYGDGDTGALNVKVYLVHGDSNTHNIYEINAYEAVGDPQVTYTNWVLKWKNGTSPHNLPNDGCDFEIEFKDATTTANSVTGGDADNKVAFYNSNDQLIDVKDGDKIVVTYWAQVKDNAVIFGSDTGNHDDSNVSSVKGNDGQALVQSDNSATSQVNTDTDNDNRNTNSSILTYGDRGHTEWSKADVTAYQIDIVKTQVESNGTFALLDGAQFSLYKAVQADSSGITNPIKLTVNSKTYTQASAKLVFVQGNDGATPSASPIPSYKFVGDATTSAGSGRTTTLTSSWKQEINVYGLEEGYYLLVEDEAPKGFNKLANPIVIYVNGDANYDGTSGSGDNESKLTLYKKGNDSNETYDNTVAWNAASIVNGTSINNPSTYSSSDGGVQVINQTGQELPSTGGIGTTIFYVVGGILVVGSAIMLVTKRRMASEA